MGKVRQRFLDLLWQGQDPFAALPRNLYHVDAQGWNESHPYLPQTIAANRPAAVAEIGVWKGASTIVMAREMQRLGIDGVVLCVDTWLGSVEHWRDSQWFDSLNLVHGYPHLQRTFMANMMAHGVQDYVVPLPLDSVNAAQLLAARGIVLDMIHLDAGHDVRSVFSDLSEWWPLLAEGGVLVGDDYFETDVWPGVRQAFGTFFAPLGMLPLEHQAGKCRVAKPPGSQRGRDALAAPALEMPRLSPQPQVAPDAGAVPAPAGAADAAPAFFSLMTERRTVLSAGERFVEMAAPGDAGALIGVRLAGARQVLFLLAADLRPIEMRGDGLLAPALSGFVVPEGGPGGAMRIRHPVQRRRFMGVTAEGVGGTNGFVLFDGAGDTRFSVFRPERLDANAVPAAVVEAAGELGAACAHPMRAETILALIGERKLRASLIEAVLRILPLDEMDQFARILLTDGRACRILARRLPASRWFAEIMPALALWQRHRAPVAGGVLTSPIEDEPVGDPFEGFGLPQAGQAICGLARAAVLPRRTACLLTCARNEGPYLLEWLAYHFSVGFEHAFIYTNDNTDGSEAMLEALAAAGAITLIHNQPGTHYGPQYKGYAHAFNLLPQILDYRWCAVLDLDEYFGFDTARFGGIADLLAWQETQPVDALAFCWQILVGTRQDRWRDAPTLRRFRLRERDANAHVKSIFRPRLAWHTHAHFPHGTLDLPMVFRTESGAIHHHPHVTGRHAAYAERPGASLGWINHYMLRSAPEALWKLARGHPDWRGDLSANQVHMALNISRAFVILADKPDLVEDTRIIGCAAGMQATLDSLRALPGVGERESEIKAHFQAAMARLTEAFLHGPFPDEPAEFKAFRDVLRDLPGGPP
jgi:predicted O-methyltransferase YrrM